MRADIAIRRALWGYWLWTNSLLAPRLAERKIKEIAHSRKPIIAGPWLSEVGYEVLYWIPFLNWVTSELGVSKDRITVISRGGAAPWYENICGSYIDVFDFLTPEEFREGNLSRVPAGTSYQKQTFISGFDREVLRLATNSRGINEYEWLHPVLMYRLFSFFWPYTNTDYHIAKHSKYQKYPAVDADGLLKELPDDYIAVKFYFASCFPNTKENRGFISDLLNSLSEKMNVVLLETGLNIDDHSDCPVDASGRIYNFRNLINPRNNLDIQTRIVSRARAFMGTYGGFSYLAPFYGVPSIAFYSNWNLWTQHVDTAYRAFSNSGFGSFTILDIRNIDAVRLLSD